MTNEELVEKIGKLLEPIKKDLQTMKQVVTHISTGVEALAAGQQDVREHVKTLSGKWQQKQTFRRSKLILSSIRDGLKM